MIEKYKNCVQELEKNQKIQINDDFTKDFELLSDFVMDFIIENLEEEGYKINDQNKIYMHFSDKSLSWESTLKNVDLVLTGGFTFNGFSDALTFYSSFWKGAFSLAPNAEVPEELKHFEQLGWFSRQAWDDGRRGCFIKQPGNFPPPIAFYSRGWFIKLDMTFEAYLENMFKMYGAKGWQFFFIEPTTDMTYKEDILEDMRVITEQFPLLFPENDWEFLNEKYEMYKQKFKGVSS